MTLQKSCLYWAWASRFTPGLSRNDFNQAADQRFSLRQRFTSGTHSCRLRKIGSVHFSIALRTPFWFLNSEGSILTFALSKIRCVRCLSWRNQLRNLGCGDLRDLLVLWWLIEMLCSHDDEEIAQNIMLTKLLEICNPAAINTIEQSKHDTICIPIFLFYVKKKFLRGILNTVEFKHNLFL